MPFEYAVHSDFLIHWTGRDIDQRHDDRWWEKSKPAHTDVQVTELYLARLKAILKYGLWMTEEKEDSFTIGVEKVTVPATTCTCFTELKHSLSLEHARRYGRLGIGVKRPFLLRRYGRPMAYYGFHNDNNDDVFLKGCADDLNDKDLLSFLKRMNSSTVTLDYDFYAESEWRILCSEKSTKHRLFGDRQIIDPRDQTNTKEYEYFSELSAQEQLKLMYLMPLDGWFAMIIYPSLQVKNRAQQETPDSIKPLIRHIKSQPDHGNRVEDSNWPIEVDLHACRNF